MFDYLKTSYYKVVIFFIPGAIPSADQVRITPSLRSQRGSIWTKNRVTFEHWEADVTFRVSGRGRMGADGLVSICKQSIGKQSIGKQSIGKQIKLHDGYITWPAAWKLIFAF